ncbi:hypothetical protein KJ855_04320 [Patescibacteria group bacterium]|nr:hypothetical protein [Patescibacteria group bacterium]
MNNKTPNKTKQDFIRPKYIIALILIILLPITGYYIWQYFSQSTIIIEPNIDNVQITLYSLPSEDNREETTSLNRIYLYENETVNNINIKVQPNQYYYITISKPEYTTINTYYYLQPRETVTYKPNLQKPFSQKNTTFPAISPNNQDIYFVNQTTQDSQKFHFSSTNIQTRETITLEENDWLGIEKVIYSPDKTKAILKVRNFAYIFQGGGNQPDPNHPEQTTKYFPPSIFYQPDIPDKELMTFAYDIDTKDLYYLGYHIENINWLDNEKIIYKYQNFTIFDLDTDSPDKVSTLNTSKFDGTGWQSIFDLKNTIYQYSIILPSPIENNTVLLATIPIEPGRELNTAIYSLNIANKEVKQLTDKSSYDASWSPDGTKILYNQLDPKLSNLPTLWIMDQNGENKRSLDIHTLVSKTHWVSNNNIAIALPIQISSPDNLSGSTIPPNYYAKPDTDTNDVLYIFNINSNQLSNQFTDIFDYIVNINHIFSNNESIFFLNAEDQLFSIDYSQDIIQ